jgi:malto-oligosyltrehalose synthase
VVRYFDHRLPICPRARDDIVQHTREAFDAGRPDGRARLHELLEQQNYRLAWWRSANDAINWRRFFDINDLVALRMDEDHVFEAVHATLFRLYGDGLIDGFRVDHIDGLGRPGAYCRKLRAKLAELARARGNDRSDEHPYLVVEKILGADEELPEDWQTDGTTGYDFMDDVSQLLHDGTSEASLSGLWTEAGGKYANFDSEERESRRQILQASFSGQLESTVRAFAKIAQQSLRTRDFARAAIRRAVTEILVHFCVYRVYTQVDHASASDRTFVSRAIQGATCSCPPGDRPIVEALGRWLEGSGPDAKAAEALAIALARFQQLSAPLSAKAVEDTAFYRNGRLLSRNDVGFDARRLACSPAQMHERSGIRLAKFPASMLATATHDHKRGEDVRARLAVLSEIAEEWGEALRRWLARSEPLRARLAGALAPSGPDLAKLFQTIVGAWPPDMVLDDAQRLSAFAQRIIRWQVKALREAKLASSWSDPNEAYESAAMQFVQHLFANPQGLLGEIADFARRIGPAGAANGLTQAFVKLTSPGMPDIYQGTEYWDLSLVDPDNRDPVDFAARCRSLKSEPMDALLGAWSDGRIKQELIGRVLAVRRSAARLFSHGGYLPLETRGPRAEHVFAFARVLDGEAVIVLGARLTARLSRTEESPALPGSVWTGTCAILPEEIQPRRWVNALGLDPNQPLRESFDLEQILAPMPVALLVAVR